MDNPILRQIIRVPQKKRDRVQDRGNGQNRKYMERIAVNQLVNRGVGTVTDREKPEVDINFPDEGDVIRSKEEKVQQEVQHERLVVNVGLAISPVVVRVDEVAEEIVDLWPFLHGRHGEQQSER